MGTGLQVSEGMLMAREKFVTIKLMVIPGVEKLRKLEEQST